jgi:hypothetical protein
MGSEVVPMAVRVDLLGSDWGQPASCRITGLEASSEDQEPARARSVVRLGPPSNRR